MKQYKWFILFGLLILFFSSCDKVTGEGPIVLTERTLPSFSTIDIRVPADIYYHTSTEYKIQIQAQQNITALLESNVSGNILLLRYNLYKKVKAKGVRIDVTSPQLNIIRLSGTGRFYAPALIEADEFQISLSGSGNAEIDSLTANDLNTSVSGSGHLMIRNGSAHTVEIEVDGSGNVDITGVTAANVLTHTSGSGAIRVTATEKLDAHISGSGNVFYKGSPEVKTEISGSGSVQKID